MGMAACEGATKLGTDGRQPRSEMETAAWDWDWDWDTDRSGAFLASATSTSRERNEAQARCTPVKQKKNDTTGGRWRSNVQPHGCHLVLHVLHHRAAPIPFFFFQSKALFSFEK